MTHTPGPWQTRKARLDPDIRIEAQYRHQAVIAKVNGYGPNCGIAEANARLIAASPELLAACKALLPEGWDDGTMDHMPGVKLAREAIAKAEGK